MSLFRDYSRPRLLAAGASTALFLAVSWMFSWQPDWCAALLVFPRWIWIAPGLLLVYLAWTREHSKVANRVALLWLVFTIFYVQEVRGILRMQNVSSYEWQNSRNNGTAIRVVSLNCNGGNENAAAEAGAYHADLILFQESPLHPALEGIAKKLAGPDAEIFSGSDVSIVARGAITPVRVENSESSPFAHATIQFASGIKAEVFVVRLQPYNIRADLWSSECWRNQRRIREQQRRQLEWIEREVEKIPPNVPIILGGDFNLPAGDRLLRILSPRLRDAFRDAGSGWGNTLDNKFPVLRIDQIWCNNRFRPAAVTAHRTINSDHRLVVSDLICVPPG